MPALCTLLTTVRLLSAMCGMPQSASATKAFCSRVYSLWGKRARASGDGSAGLPAERRTVPPACPRGAVKSVRGWPQVSWEDGHRDGRKASYRDHERHHYLAGGGHGAQTPHGRRLRVGQASFRRDTHYVTGRTSDGLVDEAWKVEGVTPTNEFYARNGVTRRRDQWLLAISPVRLSDLIGEAEVERINRGLLPGQYAIKYVEVDLDGDAAVHS